MTEKNMRRRVVKALHDLDPIAVENPAYPGTPDVNCTLGWIELKQLEGWPVRATTAVRIPHFTQQQRVWLKRRWRQGGSAWLLLQIGQHWMLFDGVTAATHVGHVDRETLIRMATRSWTRGLDVGELTECMRKRSLSQLQQRHSSSVDDETEIP